MGRGGTPRPSSQSLGAQAFGQQSKANKPVQKSLAPYNPHAVKTRPDNGRPAAGWSGPGPAPGGPAPEAGGLGGGVRDDALDEGAAVGKARRDGSGVGGGAVTQGVGDLAARGRREGRELEADVGVPRAPAVGEVLVEAALDCVDLCRAYRRAQGRKTRHPQAQSRNLS